MANTDWAFGFMPWNVTIRANYYAIATAPVINFFHGDIVGVSGAHLLTPKMGYLPGLYTAAVPDGLDNLVGAVLALFDENMDPVPYIVATEVGNGTIAGYALVADAPGQRFVGREDFATNAITTAEGSNNADIVSVALCAGNTNTGRSTQLIDSDSAGTAAALNLKLYGPVPADVALVADDTPGSSGDQGARWICEINEHYYAKVDAAGGASA